MSYQRQNLPSLKFNRWRLNKIIFHGYKYRSVELLQNNFPFNPKSLFVQNVTQNAT